MRKLLIALTMLCGSVTVRAQFLMDMIDTTKDMGKGLISMYKKFNYIQIGGYLQPEFQVASKAGAKSFGGGDFSPYSNNRFLIRRGRIRFDYMRYDKLNRPAVQFALQFDGTEKGVNIRDFWGRVFENKYQAFAFTMGMFARPFGYEVNLASSDREAPERGRMSQTLMKTERDLGAMATFEPRGRQNFLKYVKVDLGVFNGQGLSGTTDYDGLKDLISQVYIKTFPLGVHWYLSGGVSVYEGGIRQVAASSYSVGTGSDGLKYFQADSTVGHVGRRLARQYYGANFQLKWTHSYGNTELRGEYWAGKQTATASSSETPGIYPVDAANNILPLYTRSFNGAFFVLLQHLGSPRHQLGIKYDWYDPNTAVHGTQLGATGTNFSAADVRYSTLGVGYIFYVSTDLKLTLWYDYVKNESTLVAGYTRDLPDNLFTMRLQFRF